MELITKPEEKPDHDKAMEMPDLMEDDTLEMIREREEYDKSIMEEIQEVRDFDCPREYIRQIELLTNSLNAVIKKINNL